MRGEFLKYIWLDIWVFHISHSFDYDNAYEKIIKFFEEQNLGYFNYSTPIYDPIHTNETDKQLYNTIEEKIKRTSCVIGLAISLFKL